MQWKKPSLRERMDEVWPRVTVVMGTLMGLFPLFHVRKKYTVKSSAGQSLIGVIFLEAGIATWLIYGILRRDRVVLISYGIGVVVGMIYLVTVWYYS